MGKILKLNALSRYRNLDGKKQIELYGFAKGYLGRLGLWAPTFEELYSMMNDKQRQTIDEFCIEVMSR